MKEDIVEINLMNNYEPQSRVPNAEVEDGLVS